MLPPQAKMISVSFSYQPLAMASSSEKRRRKHILPGILQLNGLAHFLGRIVGALGKAVTITAAGRVGAAAAAHEAQLLKAVLHHGIAGR